MLSVLIPTDDSAADLQALLPALVPAAVDGLIREVLAADAGSTDPTLEICEDAGVRVVAGGLAAAAGAAKGEWLLVLPAGMRLPGDWAERLGAFLARGKRPALLPGLRAPGLTARFRPVEAGLVVERARLAGGSETRDVRTVVRTLGRGAVRL